MGRPLQYLRGHDANVPSASGTARGKHGLPFTKPTAGDTVGLMASTGETGSHSEAMVLALLLRAGYNVLVPYNVARYDLALDDHGKLLRLQVKTGRVRNGVILFNAFSVGHPGTPKRYYTSEEVDYFAVYVSELDKAYLVPLERVGKHGSLRVEPAKNNQSSGVLWAKDYEISGAVAQ